MPTRKKRKPTGKVAYFNRELSWLAFNRRVLDLAIMDKFPVMERLKFLAITSSNLDEFFEIRVAGLVQQVDSGVIEVGMDDLGPKEQLRRIHAIARDMVDAQYKCWREQLVPELKKNNIHFKTSNELNKAELKWIVEYFHEQVFPVLTPLAIDPAHPFPQLANKGLNVAVWLDDPSTPEIEKLLAVIPVPRILPRVIHVTPSAKNAKPCFVFLSDIIKIFAEELFTGYKVRGAWAFRITRNSDLYFDEEEVENLLQMIEQELHNRRKGSAVRLEIEDSVDEKLLADLLDAIHLPAEYVFNINGPINLLRLMPVYDMVDRDDLKFPTFTPTLPPAFAHRSGIFSAIAKDDFLLHHPYESFTPVVDFIKQAARDPKVFAIKQTLYRTSGDSPIIQALKEASANGKQVTALVELKARFDEANNIQWARELEETGVHVVYGLVGLKTHCKCCLIVRREDNGLRRYAHLGTGNYNPKTAKMYTDNSYFTAREEITAEVAALFNTLTGFARTPEFTKLLVAPFNLHSGINEKILREADNAAAGKPARLIVKVNSLIDQETINNLYVASQSGVKVDLIVRGICGLVPGVKGLSENIRVHSIVGRYLEHSRIFYFENSNGEHPEIYMGSADWMQRNFFRRIECVFPIEDEKLREYVIKELLPPFLQDNEFATKLQPNGSYQHMNLGKNEKPFSCQNHFMQQADEQRKTIEKAITQEEKTVVVHSLRKGG